MKGNNGANKGKKYNLRSQSEQNFKLARCGHVSREGRYFRCENCVAVLPADEGDLIYHQVDDLDFDTMDETDIDVISMDLED